MKKFDMIYDSEKVDIHACIKTDTTTKIFLLKIKKYNVFKNKHLQEHLFNREIQRF